MIQNNGPHILKKKEKEKENDKIIFQTSFTEGYLQKWDRPKQAR